MGGQVIGCGRNQNHGTHTSHPRRDRLIVIHPRQCFSVKIKHILSLSWHRLRYFTLQNAYVLSVVLIGQWINHTANKKKMKKKVKKVKKKSEKSVKKK